MKKVEFKNNSTFTLENPNNINYLYFPLSNTKNIFSAITPNLTGDIKASHNSYLTKPTSVEDLKDLNDSRNIILQCDDRIWSITGNTPMQLMHEEKIELEAGFLYHKIKRYDFLKQFKAEITNFSPIGYNCEMMKVTITNISNKSVSFKPTVSIPIFGRSADNLHDHRHVTSLLNRGEIYQNGIVNKPTLSFDERGHNKNFTMYGVFVSDEYGNDVVKYMPDRSQYVLKTTLANPNFKDQGYHVGDEIMGKELIAAMELPTIELDKNDTYSMVIILAIDLVMEHFKTINSISSFDSLFEESVKEWESILNKVSIGATNENLHHNFKWISLQPILRRIFGNSYLPYHDYGKGGKGWRDLWQDLLTINITDTKAVRENLINNFKGVRIDGSNATIIGDGPGEFKADRNNITRVWMDHAFWPFQTVYRYLHKSGDMDLLLENIPYFKDQFIKYCKETSFDDKYQSNNMLLAVNKKVYLGSVLEHILVENLVPFYNVGSHNIIRLEDADWNDGMDMAKQNGESVAFTSAYYLNYVNLIEVLEKLKTNGLQTVSIFEELTILLDDDYEKLLSLEYKYNKLYSYLVKTATTINGRKVDVDINKIIENLNIKAIHIKEVINKQELCENGMHAFVNGYYDNHKNKLSNIESLQFTLTGQVFPLMADIILNKEYVDKIVSTTKAVLFNKTMGGYQLNSDFKKLKTDMGRMFGFAYGTKENGSMFTHMDLMYIYALYDNGYVNEGLEALETLLEHIGDIDKVKTYPGLPEYIDLEGIGYYPFLTGSASWFVLTVIEQVYGIKGDFGNVRIEPKLQAKQFVDDITSVIVPLMGNKSEIIIENKLGLNYGEYEITKILIDNKEIEFKQSKNGALIEKSYFNRDVQIKIILGEKND